MMLFVLALVLLPLLFTGIYIPPRPVDYKPFKTTIHRAVTNANFRKTFEPLTDASRYLDCHMPQSAIMFTLSNSAAMELVVLQHKAMEVLGLRECLENKFVVVCLDDSCQTQCNEARIKYCALVPVKTVASDFLQGSYRFLSFLKHVFMFEALKEVSEVFFFDADVLLFRNPWPDTTHFRDDDGKSIAGSGPDLMWQVEKGTSLGCAGAANGGQLFVRNSTRAQHYFHLLFQKEAQIVGDQSPMLDQGLLPSLSKAANLTTCSLSPHLFLAHAPEAGERNSLLDTLVSYHAATVGLKDKAAIMAKVARLVEARKFLSQFGNSTY